MKKIFLIFLLAISSATLAQKIKILQGDINFLEGQTSLKTEFVYDNMIIGKNKGMKKPETEYRAEKKKTYNEKEPGRGDTWEQAWIADRQNRFEPQFRELFSEYSKISTVDEKAHYTLIFITTMTEPGWDVGITRMPAFIDAEVWIVETQNREHVMVKFLLTNAPGKTSGSMWALGLDSSNYEVGIRLQEAYAKSGKTLGKLITSKRGKS